MRKSLLLSLLLVLLLALTHGSHAQLDKQQHKQAEIVEEVRERVRHAQADIQAAHDMLDRTTERPSVLSRATDKVKGLFGGEGEHRHADTGSGSVLSRTKNRVADFLGMNEQDLSGAVKHTGEKAKEAASSMYEEQVKPMAQQAQETVQDVLHKIKLAIGVEEPTLYEKIRTALSPSQPTLMDKLKSAFSTEEPSTPEKIANKIRVALGGEPRGESFLLKIKHALGLPEDVTRAATEKAAETYREVQPAVDLLVENIGDKYHDIKHKVSVAIGTEDPTLTEKIKSVFEPADESIVGKIKHGLVGKKPLTRQSILDKVNEFITDYTPERQQSTLRRVKIALGIEKPGLVEQLREKFFGEPSVVDKGKEAAANAAKAAQGTVEELTGKDLDDLAHQLKVAVGAEDSSVWEKIKSAFQPSSPGIVSTIKNAFGSGKMTRDNIFDKIKSSLNDYDSGRSEPILEKVRGILYPQHRGFMDKLKDAFKGTKTETDVNKEPSTLTKAADKLAGWVGMGSSGTDSAREGLDSAISHGKSQLDQAIEALRKSTPQNREQAYTNLQHAVDEAKRHMSQKSTDLYQAFTGGQPSTVQKLRDDLADRFRSVYDSITRTSRDWMTDLDHYRTKVGESLKAPFKRDTSYLLQSTKDVSGCHASYINDNGREFLDVTGDADPKTFQALKLLNDFRAMHDLEPHASIPSDTSVQYHSNRRPHVMIKSSKEIADVVFRYVNDDGEEELIVEWPSGLGEADRHLDKDSQNQILQMFRESHGIKVDKPHHPAHISMSVKKGSAKEDL